MLSALAAFRKFSLCLGLLLLGKSGMPQYHDSAFFHYTTREGLSDNFISSLEQDDWGYLWIGSENGLNRFDGYAFKKFFPSHSSLPLLSATIRRLERYGSHQLGIITRQGLQLLNTRNLAVSNYQLRDSTAFSNYYNASWDAEYFGNQAAAVSTASGFYVFKNAGEITTRYDAYQPEDIGKKRILYGRDILRVSKNEYIIYTEENGLGLYEPAVNTYREIPPGDKNWDIFRIAPAPEVNVHSQLFPAGNNEFIFFYFRKDSIALYNHETKKLVVSAVPFSTKNELTWQSRIVALDGNNFAINGGLKGFYTFHLDRETGKIRFNPRLHLPSFRVNSIFLDKDKRLWVGTTRGLLQQRFSGPFMEQHHYPAQSSDISTRGLQYAYRYKDKLYVCRYSRFNGVLVIDTSTMQVEKRIVFNSNDDPANEITSAEMYHPDTLWLGTNRGILWLDTKSHRYGKVGETKNYPGLETGPVMLAPARPDGYAWFCIVLEGLAGRYHIATRRFEFFTPRTTPALPFSKVKSIAYDSYGDVWLGGHSLARWNSAKNEFDTLIQVYGGTNKFNDDILAISADQRGSLWLHNVENGLLEYRIKEKKFIPYTMNEGLPSMMLTCFSPVIDDVLWIGSANHLTRFDTKTRKIFVYDYHDGFPAESPAGRRIYYDSLAKKFYLFTKETLVHFSSLQNQQNRHSLPFLQEVQVNNMRSVFHPGDTLHLKYRENSLVLQFSIIDFESPNSYQLSYRINNAETWTATGPQRLINLTKLQPGKYVLQVRATGNDDQEEIRTIVIFIAPPFWETIWFFLICLLVAGGLIYYFYRRRITMIRKKADLDKQLAQTEMKALHAQMNPHFIFNSLNSIREMILNNKTREASHFLSKFAHLMRLTLDHSSRPFITLRKTIDYLHRYMEMEQIRNIEFTCRILADPELDADQTELPPLLIQPFIENAIWHGVTSDRKNININIDFRKENGQLVCIVDDNGIGIDQSLRLKSGSDPSHSSVGISNVRNRIQLLNEKYGLESSVLLQDKLAIPGAGETGTRVTIRLPLQLNTE